MAKGGGWITIKGTHVMIDGGGRIVAGPGRLTGGSSNEGSGSSGGGSSTGSSKNSSDGILNKYVNELKPDVEYDERVNYWKKQIKEGNHRPILVSDKDYLRVVDGNHTLAAYKELKMTPPKIYAVNRIDFLNGAADMGDDLKWIEQAIKSGKAVPVSPVMLKTDDRLKKLF